MAKTGALTHAAAEFFDDVVGVDAVEDRRSLERLAHLVGAVAESGGSRGGCRRSAGPGGGA